MAKNKTLQERKEILEEYRNSNTSGTKFCAERKLNSKTFYGWIKKENQKKVKNKLDFIPLSVQDNSKEIKTINKQTCEKIILKTKEGVYLKIPQTVSASWISSLLKDLK